MIILVYGIVWLFIVALGTCVLVVALWLLSEKDSNPLDDLGLTQCFHPEAVPRRELV